MFRLLFITVLLLQALAINAQSVLSGRIYEKETDTLIAGVNVVNKRTFESVRSGKDGWYSLPVNEGDMVIFSATGFAPDTMAVTYDKLLTQQDITLHTIYISLKNVKITNSYSRDSLERREEYKDIYDQKNIIGNNRPADGVGVSLSPLSYFSSKARQERALRKKLERDEKESYIDHAFPKELVENYTHLHDDSLRLFMYLYRPSYEFCRKTDRANMIVYISDKVKEFRKPRKKVK